MMTTGQKIAIGAGILLAFGVGYYIYRKMKMPAGDAGADTGSGGGGSGGSGTIAEATNVTAGRGMPGAGASPSARANSATISSQAGATTWTSSQRGGGTVVRPSAPVLRVTPVTPRPVTRPTTTVSR